jgi:hypothetical protein
MDSFDQNEFQPTDLPPNIGGDTQRVRAACDRWLKARGLKADEFNPRFVAPSDSEAES